MANVNTTLVIKAKNETNQGINEAKSSFQEFTSSIDSITGGLGSKITSLLANPWTGVAAAVGVAAKSLKDLTEAGMEGQDRLLKFSAMLGSKGEASSLIGTISKLSDTSFESRDAIEAFAEKLVGAGRSAEEVEKILSATIDISNTSGRSFKEVGSAIENAFAGKTTQIEKMVPGLKDLGDEAWNSGDAIKYIGDELHDASIQIASGSLSNQLGAIGNSWQQIKENLGASIVTQIQATGILDTIANWLEKIEDHTRKQQEASFYEGDWGYIKNQAKAGQFGNINEALLSGTLSAEAARAWVNQFEGQIVPFQWQRDTITAITRALEELDKVTAVADKTVDELDLDFFSIIKQWRAVDDPKKMSDAVKEGFLSSLDAIESGYIAAGADQSRLENLAKLRSNIDTGAPNVSEWQLFTAATASGATLRSSTKSYEASKSPYTYMLMGDWEMLDQSDFGKAFNAALLSGNEDAWDEVQTYYDAWLLSKATPSTSSTGTPTVVTTPTKTPSISAWDKLGVTPGTYFYNEVTGKIEETTSILSRITSNEWSRLSDSDWNQALNALGSIPEESRDTWSNWLADKYVSYLAWKNPPAEIKAATTGHQRTTGGGGVNTLEGFTLVDGVWTPDGSMVYDPVLRSWKKSGDTLKADWTTLGKVGYREQLAYEAQFTSGKTPTEAIEEQTDEEKKSFEDIAKDVEKGFNTVTSAVNALKAWGDGQYQQGEVGSGIGAIGSVVSLFAPKVGAVLGAVGAGVGLLEALFGGGEETDLSGTTDADYQTSLATYNGGLNLTINNNFEGANIVGAGGMEELAMTVQRQIEHWAFDNR